MGGTTEFVFNNLEKSNLHLFFLIGSIFGLLFILPSFTNNVSAQQNSPDNGTNTVDI